MLKLITQYFGAYVTGFGVAIAISFVVIVLSVFIGTFGAIARTSQRFSLRFLAAAYVAIFRGLPPLLILYLVYFGLPTWAAEVNIPILSELLRPLDNRIVAAIVGFTLASGAYSTEIIRAGIASVKKEQVEAARSIGMTYGLAFRRVIAPQAFRTAFPPLSNEYITVLKSTSLASVIGVAELMRAAQMAGNITFQFIATYSIAGFFYVAFVVILQTIFHRVEKLFR